jgi:hypothetical protein
LSHPLRSSVVSASRRVLSSRGQMRMCSAVSLRPQFGHFSFRHSRPEYFPTWTLVPQKPVCCSDLHILYMSDFDDMARSRCSQSTSSKRSCGHFLVPVSMRRATSLLVWNQTGCDTLLVIVFPHITIATSSHGSICVVVLIYPAVMALWTAPFAVVSHTQLNC